MTDQFIIVLDHVNKCYWAGQNVSGRVIVSGGTETLIKGLEIQCSGYAQTNFSKVVTRRIRAGQVAGGRAAQSEDRYQSILEYYSATEKYFEFRVFIVGDGAHDCRIPPGRNEYAFNFRLPPGLPCSFSGAHGSVAYNLLATMKTSWWQFDKKVKEYITLVAIVDLNNYPFVGAVERLASKNFCCLCCASGPVGFHISLPKTSFVAGEHASPTVKIFNESGRGIDGVTVSFLQTVRYYAQGASESTSNTFYQIMAPSVDPGDTVIWQPILEIPAVPPSNLGGCRIIDVAYSFKFELNLSGAFDLEENIPVMIGTIPQIVASPPGVVNGITS